MITIIYTIQADGDAENALDEEEWKVHIERTIKVDGEGSHPAELTTAFGIAVLGDMMEDEEIQDLVQGKLLERIDELYALITLRNATDKDQIQ